MCPYLYRSMIVIDLHSVLISVNRTELKMIPRSEIALRWMRPGTVAEPHIAGTVAELHITGTVAELHITETKTNSAGTFTSRYFY